jgi:formyl-CoA transferase
MQTIINVNAHHGESPHRIGISLGDSLAGLFAALGALAAVYRRERDAAGSGYEVVDVSILESCFAMLESAAPEYDRLGVVREPGGTRMPGIAPSNVFRSRDGRMVVIAANQDSLFRRLCEVMGRPELADDPRFAGHRARYEHEAELEAEISRWASKLTAAEIDAALAPAGVVCAEIYSIADIFADPHVAAREMLVEHRDPELGSFTGPGIVPKFDRDRGSVRWTGPWEPGAHNREVFQGLLARSDAELARLEAAGVV